MKVGLVILDGWGLNPDDDARDAVAAASTPVFDGIREAGAFGTLETHGRRVGLPEGQMGNSEVGHLNIGAGRVLTQESARITDAIARYRGEGPPGDPDDPPLDENRVLVDAIDSAVAADGRVHVLGLVSDGGVHSYQDHVHALVDLVADRGGAAVVHAFTDGRDSSPTGGVDYLRELSAHVGAVEDAAVATVCGRYYAMDRDENWERTHRAYDAIVDRAAEYTAPSPVAAVEAAYERETTDEFVEPTLVEGGPPVRDGDTIIFANFRADRARQLTRLLGDIDPVWPFEATPPDVELVTMTEYNETFGLPVAFPPRQPEDTLGEVLADTGHTQLRIAETEKYAHVTYFLNGGNETAFEGERREIVPSPDVATYDEQPEMSAPDVTDRALDVIAADDPDVVVLNYANPDMVGHTGDFDAAVRAVEAVDEQLGRLLAGMHDAGAAVLVTADHGNADDIGTVADPHTAHTTNPVPFVFLDSDGGDGGRAVRDGGTLADVAPTVLDLLGVDRPGAMTSESLLE